MREYNDESVPYEYGTVYLSCLRLYSYGTVVPVRVVPTFLQDLEEQCPLYCTSTSSYGRESEGELC